MEKILKSRYGLLIFSLISGVAYFLLIMMLIAQVKFSYLLGLFFFPAIVCGGALCLYKTIKNLEEANEIAKIKSLMVIHIFVVLLAAAFFAVSLLTK